MNCPICYSEDISILKSKKISSKNKITEELLLRCNECQHVFKDSILQKKPQPYRIIISEQDKSLKSTIKLCPNDELRVGDTLITDLGQVEVTSIEIDGKRVKKSLIEDIVTIWASSLEIPARIGVSVDLHGIVDSYKVDLERDFKIAVGDILKIENHIIKINIIKTRERKTTSWYAKAGVIKRIYGKPVNLNNFDFDLTNKIVKKTVKPSKYVRK